MAGEQSIWFGFIVVKNTLCEKSTNTECYLYLFSRIWTEYGDLHQSKYGKIRTRKNSVFGHISRTCFLSSCFIKFYNYESSVSLIVTSTVINIPLYSRGKALYCGVVGKSKSLKIISCALVIFCFLY